MTNNKAEKLATFTRNLQDFVIHEDIDGNYQNMGAIIIDGILQAGIKYETTVRPRVKRYLINYQEITTTSQFAKLIAQETVSSIIEWKPSAKTERIQGLTEFLVENSIETQEEFKEWLSYDENINKLKSLSGIGDKTADYFKILCGHKNNAIDRHLLNFLEMADIRTDSYDEAHKVISKTSVLLNLDEAVYDHSIWRYMSSK